MIKLLLGLFLGLFLENKFSLWDKVKNFGLMLWEKIRNLKKISN